MEGRIETAPPVDPPYDVLAPDTQTLPVVLASPHSGVHYPAEFLTAARLDAFALRRSEDSFVDEIFGAAPSIGVPLLRARFARAYLDANREPFELDPQMFDEALPAFVNSRSPRVGAGLGTIARIVASGENIYARKLAFSDAERRIDLLYRPYHRALRQLVETTRQYFGHVILVDCHSMPSGASGGDRAGWRGTDIVLGDCHGTSCSAVVTDTAEAVLRRHGYRVSRNAPYAGGFTTGHYGAPAEGRHALQIEINRGLYMNEQTMAKKPFLREIAGHMTDVVTALARIDGRILAP